MTKARPRRQRREGQFNLSAMHMHDQFTLHLGYVCENGKLNCVIVTDDDLKEAWLANRDELMQLLRFDQCPYSCTGHHPGCRPRAWWRFEAPELPRVIGEGEVLGHELIHESQASCLERLGLLSDEEKAMLAHKPTDYRESPDMDASIIAILQRERNKDPRGSPGD